MERTQRIIQDKIETLVASSSATSELGLLSRSLLSEWKLYLLQVSENIRKSGESEDKGTSTESRNKRRNPTHPEENRKPLQVPLPVVLPSRLQTPDTFRHSTDTDREEEDNYDDDAPLAKRMSQCSSFGCEVDDSVHSAGHLQRDSTESSDGSCTSSKGREASSLSRSLSARASGRGDQESDKTERSKQTSSSNVPSMHSQSRTENITQSNKTDFIIEQSLYHQIHHELSLSSGKDRATKRMSQRRPQNASFLRRIGIKKRNKSPANSASNRSQKE